MDLHTGYVETTTQSPPPKCWHYEPPKLPPSSDNAVQKTSSTPPAAQSTLYQQPMETILDQPAPWLQTWAKSGHAYFNQQLKQPQNRQPYGPLTSATSSDLKLSKNNDLQPPWEILLHCTSVGLLVHNSLRKITLKMLIFCCESIVITLNFLLPIVGPAWVLIIYMLKQCKMTVPMRC